MKNDIQLYEFSINIMKNNLTNIRKINESLIGEIKDRNSVIIDQIENNIDCLVNNINTIKKDSIVIEKCNILIEVINNTIDLLNSMSKNNLIDNDDSIWMLNKYIVEEIKKLKKLLDRTNTFIDYQYNENIGVVEKFENYISDNINDTKITIEKLLFFEEKDLYKNNSEFRKIVLSLEDILNDKSKVLNNLYSTLINIISDEKSELYNEYKKFGTRIINLLKNYSDVNSKIIINKLNNSTVESLLKRKINNYNEQDIMNIDIDEEQRKKDIEKYKNDYSILNKSFWEARYKASEEKIKYPSVLFERKVKEYQNDFLIKNYNRSLEEIESSLDDYRNKYAKEIYMDEVYEEAIKQLRNETLLTFDEMCDETFELSQLDRKVYEILSDRLMNVIREIGHIKSEENIDEFVDIFEYRKNIKLNELLDKKELIEFEMNSIIRKKDKIENN